MGTDAECDGAGRRPVKRLAAALFVTVVPFTTGCAADSPERGSDGSAAALAEDSAAFVAQADMASLALMQTLSGRLTAALGEGGAAHAIEFCATAARPLTDSVGSAHDVELLRVTDRTRNAANAADADDRAAMAAFASALAESGSVPPYRVQRTAGGELRYYRPLLVGALCEQCHGPVDGLAADVVRVLRERYPDDAATGYTAGELRGVLRVAAPSVR
jgi:hypothetical protein